ncbi:MAG: hypothetical protein ACRCYP_03815 [Alphaproteobacteria bacterium]
MKFSWNEDYDMETWMCPACEEEICSMDELTLEPFKVLPEGCDRRATILSLLNKIGVAPQPQISKPVDDYSQALELFRKAYAGDREAIDLLMRLLQKRVEVCDG